MRARLWKTAAMAGGISVLAAVLFLAGGTALSLQAVQSDAYVGVLVWAALMVGALLAGLIGGKSNADRPLVGAVLSAGVYTVILGLLTLPFGEGFSFFGFLSKAGLPIAAAAAVGVFLQKSGTNRYGNRRKAAKHAGKIYKGKR